MPWTFAHPAAVLLFRKIGPVRLPLVPLIVGSLVPDLGYYLNSKTLAQLAHSSIGLLIFCLPVGLALVALLYLLWPRVIQLLPNPHRFALAHLNEPSFPRNLSALCTTVIAIVLGASTHVVWDSFTHGTGAVVERIPLLGAHVFTIGSRDFFTYNVLQHLSTLTGVAILCITYMKWLRSAARNIERDSLEFTRYAIIAACLFTAVVLGVIASFISLELESNWVSVFVFRTIVFSTNVFVILFLIAAVIWANKYQTLIDSCSGPVDTRR